MLPCLVLPYEEATGPANMALDEALLERVAADPSAAILRIYGWLEPTLSLGYFQSRNLIEREDRWREVAVVRRPTGGGALWHDHEVTYAIVIPKQHPLARHTNDLYRAVHSEIATLLAAHGVSADRRGSSGGEASDEKPFLCFADRDDNDVVAGPVKLVGSAQRRRAGAVLQHGSLLLEQSATTPELAGAAQLGVAETGRLYWARLLADALPRALECTPIQAEIDREMRDFAAQLEANIYRSRAWIEKR